MATHPSVLAWRILEMGGAWWAAVNGVTQSQARTKRLSSSSRGTWRAAVHRAAKSRIRLGDLKPVWLFN